MTTLSVTAQLSGGFFRGDAGSEVEAMLRATVDEVMETGVNRLDEVLRPRPKGVYLSVSEAGRGKASTGHYRRSLHAERRGFGGVIDDSGVVYGPWLEGTSSRNQTTRFKGYRSFQKTGSWLQGQVVGILSGQVRRLIAGKWA